MVGTAKRNMCIVAVLGVVIQAMLISAVVSRVDAAEPTCGGVLTQAAARADKIQDRFVRTWARYEIAGELVHTNPRAAADLADKLESWTAKQDLFSVIMRQWGRHDPKAAVEWALKYRERTQGLAHVRRGPLHCVIVGLVGKNPKYAEELLSKHMARHLEW